VQGPPRRGALYSKSLVCVLEAQIEVPRNTRVTRSTAYTSRSIADDLTATAEESHLHRSRRPARP
jgi:hypothetical protein